MQGFLDADLTRLPAPIRAIVGNRLLAERPSREADYRAEVEATQALLQTLRESPAQVLDRLANTLLKLAGADSAGVSLVGRREGQRVFIWQATAGYLGPHYGHMLKYEESPCGSVLDTGSPLLMIDPLRAYGDAVAVTPPPRELLLVPFEVGGRNVGTVWLVSQSDKQFDAEDARIATNLSKVAALAYQVLTRVEHLELLHRNVQDVAEDAITLSQRAGRA